MWSASNSRRGKRDGSTDEGEGKVWDVCGIFVVLPLNRIS